MKFNEFLKRFNEGEQIEKICEDLELNLTIMGEYAQGREGFISEKRFGCVNYNQAQDGFGNQLEILSFLDGTTLTRNS